MVWFLSHLVLKSGTDFDTFCLKLGILRSTVLKWVWMDFYFFVSLV